MLLWLDDSEEPTVPHEKEVTVIHIRTWMILTAVALLLALGYFTRWWVPVLLLVVLTVYVWWWLSRNACCIGSGPGSVPSDSN
jgi:fatty acid desaturase